MSKVGQLNPRRVRAWAWEQATLLRRRAIRRQEAAKEMMFSEVRTTRLRQAAQDNAAADRFIKIVQVLNDFPGCINTTGEEDVRRIGKGERL